MGLLDSGVYFLNYHSVGWEESPYTRGIPKYTVPVDKFRRHLGMLCQVGQLVSANEALGALQQGNVTEPLIALWFDDGHRGVLKWADREMEKYGISGLLSVCSNFVEKKELYWRCKLSYLSHLDLMRYVRGNLRQHGINVPLHIRKWTKKNFEKEMIKSIDKVFKSDKVQKNATKFGHDKFLSKKEVKSLKKKGWVITNHTYAHYPIRDKKEIISGFQGCEKLLNDISGSRKYWVVPFSDGPQNRISSIAKRKNRTVVWVRDKVNNKKTLELSNSIYRIDIEMSTKKMKNKLLKI